MDWTTLLPDPVLKSPRRRFNPQGSAYVEPVKSDPVKASSVAERIRQFQVAHDALKSCKDVVVVGGGFVGVELAAEIVGKWGNSKVTTH